MVRGATPTHVIRVKDGEGEYVNFTDATAISVTYKQDDLMEMTKTMEDGVSVTDEGHVKVQLTKSDTMSLFPGICRVQIEADFGGNVVISDAGKIKVENRLKSGE